jgi:hypothetical protein
MVTLLLRRRRSEILNFKLVFLEISRAITLDILDSE